MKEESELMPMNYPNSVPSQVPYRTAAPLTNQVPNLSAMPGVNQDERWGFLPFIGGLALGGLLFDGWGGGRPCCGGGGYAYPVYQPCLPTGILSTTRIYTTILSRLPTTSFTNGILWTL